MSMEKLLERFHPYTAQEQQSYILRLLETWSHGHSCFWHLDNSSDSELCWSEFLCQCSHLLLSHKWNNSLKGKFVLRCHSHMHTIYKLLCISAVQHYTNQDLVFLEKHVARHFLEMLLILDTCHIRIETYGLQCAISNHLQRLCDQRCPVLPPFYESVFT